MEYMNKEQKTKNNDRIFQRSLPGNLHVTKYDPYVATCKLCACAQMKNDQIFQDQIVRYTACRYGMLVARGKGTCLSPYFRCEYCYVLCVMSAIYEVLSLQCTASNKL